MTPSPDVFNFVDPSAIVGRGTVIWHFGVILDNVTIGKDCSIGSCAEIGSGSIIGDKTSIGSGVFLPANSEIGSGVFIGPGVVFADNKYPRGNKPYLRFPPVVEDGASIGAGAVILPGLRIGANSMVSPGTIVTSSVPSGTLVRSELPTIPATHENYAAAIRP